MPELGTGRVVDVAQEHSQFVGVAQRQANRQVQPVGGGQAPERWQLEPGHRFRHVAA